MTWAGRPSTDGNRVRSDFVARDDRAERALQGGHVERSADPEAAAEVVGRAAGIELVDEPESLLRERQRQRTGCATPARSAGSLASYRPPSVSLAASPATVGSSKSARSGNSTCQRALHERQNLRREQRVAAEREEVVVRRRPARTPSTLAPDLRQRLFDRRCAAPRTCRRRPGGPRAGVGSALRSTLPLGVSGSASSVHEADGTMYSGRRSLTCCAARAP